MIARDCHYDLKTINLFIFYCIFFATPGHSSLLCVVYNLLHLAEDVYSDLYIRHTLTFSNNNPFDYNDVSETSR